MRSYESEAILQISYQEHKNVANATLETLNARRDLMTSWSAAQKKEASKRKLEKRDEDFKTLLSSKNLFQICHGNQHINAIKQLASSSEQTSGGKDVSKVLSDKAHCEVRDWLITRLLIDNSGRSGVAANMKVSEFQEAMYYPGKEEDRARYRITKLLKFMAQLSSGFMMICISSQRRTWELSEAKLQHQLLRLRKYFSEAMPCHWLVRKYPLVFPEHSRGKESRLKERYPQR